jgi:UDP-N-acetylglucosamine diphosphorylase/glucosamine-1-phosphate N-acetyltransferase
MSGFVLYDDAIARDFAPFALTRPAGELRAGAMLTRERWAHALRAIATGFVSGAHLRDFAEFDAPPACVGHIAAGTWLVNARCAPAIGEIVTHNASVIRCNGRIAAVKLAADLPLVDLADGTVPLESIANGAEVAGDGWWLEHVWDVIGLLPAMLQADALALLPPSPDARSITVMGKHSVHVDASATIEPYVVADTSNGPVVIQRGAHVYSFTRLVGPCVVGEDSTLMGGRFATVSVGPHAKLNGEMSVCVVIGHANKGHDGFVGHSVLGRWSNLGAGTITSNLKNSYGEVSLWTPSGVARTGLQFLGALIGDHVKTGIGLRLSTGSVLGAGANVFGSRIPPKVVPPFAWGDGEPWDTFALDRFLTVATRVMGRRKVVMSTSGGAHWARVFAARDDA